MFNLPTDNFLSEPLPEPPRTRRELLTPLPDNDYLLVLDNTSIEKFVTCPRSAEFYLCYGRELNVKSVALVFGGALHEGLEAFHLGLPEDQQNKRIVDFFANHPVPPDEYRTCGNALEVLRLYRKKCAIDPAYEWQVHQDEKGPIVERAFELPLGVIPINATVRLPRWPEPRFIRNVHVGWNGRIDLVTGVNGENYITDHKTTSIGDDKFIQDFQLSNPVLGYTWAGRKKWPELDLAGFCLNAIWFKKPTGTGPLDERGPRGGEPALRFFRSYFRYSESMIEQWEENILEIVSDFLHCIVRDYHPMHTKWCFGKYGKCQYHDVCCTQDPEVRLRFLKSEVYKDVTWDPVAGR